MVVETNVLVHCASRLDRLRLRRQLSIVLGYIEAKFCKESVSEVRATEVAKANVQVAPRTLYSSTPLEIRITILTLFFSR